MNSEGSSRISLLGCERKQMWQASGTSRPEEMGEKRKPCLLQWRWASSCMAEGGRVQRKSERKPRVPESAGLGLSQYPKEKVREKEEV